MGTSLSYPAVIISDCLLTADCCHVIGSHVHPRFPIGRESMCPASCPSSARWQISTSNTWWRTFRARRSSRYGKLMSWLQLWMETQIKSCHTTEVWSTPAFVSGDVKKTCCRWKEHNLWQFWLFERHSNSSFLLSISLFRSSCWRFCVCLEIWWSSVFSPATGTSWGSSPASKTQHNLPVSLDTHRTVFNYQHTALTTNNCVCALPLCSIILTTAQYLSPALHKNFTEADFDFKVRDFN